MRLLVIFALAFLAVPISRAQDAAFVVNKDTKLAALSHEDAKNILLGNKVKFEDGAIIKLAVQSEGPVHEKVIRDFTQRSTDQFEKYWKKLVFTGKGLMPSQCKSDAEVIEYVAHTPGAFGYVAKVSVVPSVSVIDVN